MGEEIKVIDVQAENWGTLIQVDVQSKGISGRLFIPVRDIFKALNNYAYMAEEYELLKRGVEKVDDSPNPMLIF